MPKTLGTVRTLSVDVTQAPVSKIFTVVHELKEELERRVDEYLHNLGYKIYKTEPKQVYHLERGNMQFIHIEADVEIDFSKSRVNLDVPLKHFDSIVFPPPPLPPERSSQYEQGHP